MVRLPLQSREYLRADRSFISNELAKRLQLEYVDSKRLSAIIVQQRANDVCCGIKLNCETSYNKRFPRQNGSDHIILTATVFSIGVALRSTLNGRAGWRRCIWTLSKKKPVESSVFICSCWSLSVSRYSR
ncbi:hypothetical protein Y032_0112g310 [Ancylostoma ceylanicum]|nr:hypothetical protein Y032_0112g310 [Ancylostoma ceylanicum]